MVLFEQHKQPFGRNHALKRLQEVQEEIYRQMQLLIPDDIAFHDSLASRVSSGRESPAEIRASAASTSLA